MSKLTLNKEATLDREADYRFMFSGHNDQELAQYAHSIMLDKMHGIVKI